MMNRSSRGSYQIRIALGFVLGLVVVLSSVAVILMDQRVSSLEEHIRDLGEAQRAHAARLTEIEKSIQIIREQLPAIEDRLKRIEEPME